MRYASSKKSIVRGLVGAMARLCRDIGWSIMDPFRIPTDEGMMICLLKHSPAFLEREIVMSMRKHMEYAALHKRGWGAVAGQFDQSHIRSALSSNKLSDSEKHCLVVWAGGGWWSQDVVYNRGLTTDSCTCQLCWSAEMSVLKELV